MRNNVTIMRTITGQGDDFSFISCVVPLLNKINK